MFPMFPTLNPRLVDPAWFNVDLPCNDEAEVNEMERNQKNWRDGIAKCFSDLIPIGTACEAYENGVEEGEIEEEDADDADVEEEEEEADNEDEYSEHSGDETESQTTDAADQTTSDVSQLNLYV